ncbi:hypothetical protein ACFVXW_17685 [Streptomyces sp. NPDC058251]|uniref:hypothetical protein n=1 Tax=Streptomyces sp. NPDC058251 TaxID=3346404 RepID=UPI0036E6332E
MVAPGHLGSGRSTAPASGEFSYACSQLAEITGEFAERLGLREYACRIRSRAAAHGVWDPSLAGPVGYEHDEAPPGRPGQPGIQPGLISEYGGRGPSSGSATRLILRAACDIGLRRGER